jgi:outer membrane protein TolC
MGILLFYLFTFLPLTAQTYSLQQLKDSALLNNIAMRSARLDIDAAQQQRKEAFTNFFPNVSGTGLWFNANKGMAQMDMNLSEQISPELGASLAQMLPPEALAALGSPISISMMKNGTIGSLMAIQPLFTGGQIINGNKLAKVGEDVSRLQLQLSENEVLKQTEQYYWQLVSLEQKMKTIDAVEALLQEIHKDVDVAVRAGVAMRNDLLQVQLRQNDIQSQKLKLQNGISLVKMLLSQYCGLNGESWSVECGKWNEDTSSAEQISFHIPPSTFNENVLPEYQLLQKQVEATKLQRKMEVGKNLPSLGIGAGYNYHNLLDNDHTFGMVFATVSVPISDWWGGSHAIKRKKIQQQKAEEQLEDNSQLLKIRMQKAWNDVQESYQQLGIARQSIEQAEENLRLNRNYYKAGTCRMSDLLEAQLLYQQSCDKHTDAYADYQNKLLEYRQATGQ